MSSGEAAPGPAASRGAAPGRVHAAAAGAVAEPVGVPPRTGPDRTVAAGAPAFRIRASSLAHRYAPGRGLEAIDFAIASPGLIAVTGPNGSGKSTLLRIVAGLLEPSAGRCEVEIDGALLPPAARRARCGFAAPELAFYDELTVGENLEFAAEASGAVDAVARVDAALDRVGLPGRRRDRVAALSSGMKQRLRLAFAILHAPPLLLLDEPESHLDTDGREVLTQLLATQRASGLVLLATNDEREWRRADQRIELHGRGLGDPA